MKYYIAALLSWNQVPCKSREFICFFICFFMEWLYMIHWLQLEVNSNSRSFTLFFELKFAFYDSPRKITWKLWQAYCSLLIIFWSILPIHHIQLLYLKCLAKGLDFIYTEYLLPISTLNSLNIDLVLFENT